MERLEYDLEKFLDEYIQLLLQLNWADASERVRVLERIKEKIAEAKARKIINKPYRDAGYTMLHLAVSHGSVETVAELLNSDADVNVQNKAGTTPLMTAVLINKLEIIELLVAKGAFVNYGRFISGNNSRCETSYLWSIQNHLKDIEYLFSKTQAVQYGSYIFNNIEAPFAELKPKLIKDACNYVDPSSNISVLELCVLNKREDLVKHILNEKLLIIDPKKELINRGLLQAVDLLINCDDEKISEDDKRNLLEIVRSLLQNGANVDKLDAYEESLLLRAVCSNNYELAKILLEFHPDLNFANDWGNTPICLAAMNGCEKLCKLLIQHNADTTVQNYSGDDCITLAMQNGYHDVVKAIVGIQAMPDLGYTPLMLDLLDEKYDDVLTNLLKNRKYTGKNALSINYTTKGGFTALMIAAQQYTETKPNEVDKRAKIWKVIDNLIRNKHADYSKQNKAGYSFLVNLACSNYIEQFIMSLWNLIDSMDGRFFQNCIAQAPELLQVIVRLAEEKKPILHRLLNRINQVDAFGMTPLAYAKFDAPRIGNQLRDERIKFLLTLVEKYNAEFLASGKTVLTPLHMKILWDPLALEWDTKKIDTTQLNVQDEHGRTPLHYACMQDSMLVTKLIDLGASCDIKDKAGRTPLHYAAIDGNDYLKIIEHLQRKDLEHVPDKFGVSPFMYALSCSGGRLFNQHNMIDYLTFDRIKDNAMLTFVGKSEANNQSAEIKAVVSRAPENISGYFKKLACYAAVANSARVGDPNRDIKEAREIVDAKHKGNAGSVDFGDNLACGIEIECASLPNATFAPLEFMLPIYDVSRVQDYTVQPSLTSPYRYFVNHKFELVTKPIKAMYQLNKTFEMLDALCVSGAKVNKTAGLHVHFNVRGSQEYQLAPYVSESEELTFLKFLVLNYINIEPLLRGFMRDGKMFDVGETYVRPVSTLILLKEVEACKSVADLQKICSHSTTLDLTALNRHGTVEFRVHEGAVDPTLVRAWVDCTARLVKLSKEQTLQHIPGGKIAPKADIEQLVYIFVAMRMYERTWDQNTNSVITATNMPPFAYSKKIKKPTQVLIQESLLYNMFNMLLGLEQVAFVDKAQPAKSIDEYLREPRVIEQLKDKQAIAHLQEDLRNMITFACDNPGIIPVNDNKKELDKEIDRVFKEISKIQTRDAESLSNIGSPTPSLLTSKTSSKSTISDSDSEYSGSPGSQSGAASSPPSIGAQKPKPGR